VKKALLSLAVAGVALSIAHEASAQTINNIRVGQQALRTVFHPSNSSCGFPITEAYLATELPFPGFNNPGGIPGNPNVNCGPVQRNFRWTGANSPNLGSPNTTAAPGVLSFKERIYNGSGNTGASETRTRIDINVFILAPANFTNCFVQSFRLEKVIPPSRKCPVTYQSQTFVQFGNNVRTWWPLTYTQPGTTFTLWLTVVCQRNTFPFDTDIHVERWRWIVVVTFESLQAVIDLLHQNPIGTSEIPCIAAENMYYALKGTVAQLERATFTPGSPTGTPRTSDSDRIAQQNIVFNLEALITVFCVFGDCFESTALNPGGAIFMTFPPSNDPQMSFGGALTGIIDTPENPCCCKLLVDVERLAEAYGIVSSIDFNF
jgi:hypothetical protein